MNMTLHSDEKGNLQVPSAVLPNAAPRRRYSLSEQNGILIIAEDCFKNDQRPFWEKATPEEKLQALQAWGKEAATPAGLSDYAVSRESIYE